MPRVSVVVESPIHRSFRVEQLAGMFDVEIERKTRQEFHVEVPGLDDEWKVGAIVGPSGSGKSTIAREAYGKDLHTGFRWPRDAAVIDGFGEATTKQISGVMNAVGFSSPPSWLKPYHVLSNGEQFRCNLARAMLLTDRPVVAFDEFTSVVDRTVAKIGSAAVAKAVRKGRGCRRFVAVTCHYDVVEWLEADWVLDMASGRLARGSLRRPTIELEVVKVHRSAWELFRKHHYLSGFVSPAATCFVAFCGETPVAFSAWQEMGGDCDCGTKREHRTVVLPDYQGLGIGSRLADLCASLWRGAGFTVRSVSGHPAVIGYRSRSPQWQTIRFGLGTTNQMPMERKCGIRSDRWRRCTGSFRYVGPGDGAVVGRVDLGGDAGGMATPAGGPTTPKMDRAVPGRVGSRVGEVDRVGAVGGPFGGQ